MTGASWYEASAYSAWDHARLPSDAEWERAVRGIERREYPWGKQEPDEKRANFGMKVGSPTPVGLYPAGATPEGVADMAGNVWEWVEDWHKRDKVRALRGRSFSDHTWILRISYRLRGEPDPRLDNVGFRCARDITS